MTNSTPYPQEDFLALVLPLLRSEGQEFQKFKEVLARPARAGEAIATVTSDGLETQNTAGEDSYVIANRTQAGEQYIIGGEKFRQRYQKVRPIDEDWALYKPTGRIQGLEMTVERLQRLGLPQELHFIAPWGEPMALKANDYLATTFNYNEVYRIARQEFFETYRAVE